MANLVDVKQLSKKQKVEELIRDLETERDGLREHLDETDRTIKKLKDIADRI